jgi:hypothetical protein
MEKTGRAKFRMEGAKSEVIKAGEFEKSRLHFHVIRLPFLLIS